MFGVALSLAEFALVEHQPSVHRQAMVARTIKPYGVP
jgi:hypothetical protein